MLHPRPSRNSRGATDRGGASNGFPPVLPATHSAHHNAVAPCRSALSARVRAGLARLRSELASASLARRPHAAPVPHIEAHPPSSRGAQAAADDLERRLAEAKARIDSLQVGQTPARIDSLQVGQTPAHIASLQVGQTPARIASLQVGQTPARIASLQVGQTLSRTGKGKDRHTSSGASKAVSGRSLWPYLAAAAGLEAGWTGHGMVWWTGHGMVWWTDHDMVWWTGHGLV